MSEATIQARLAAALEPLVAEGSVLVNDYRTPQVASQARSPWVIVETADAVRASTGAAWTVWDVVYEPFVALLTYRRGQSDAAHVGAFQALRQQVIAALLAVEGVDSIETAAAIGPYFAENGDEDPDSLFQRLRVTVKEYEV